MNAILKFLHAITPFHYSYTKWSDTKDCTTHGFSERQQRFCTICNKKQYRTVNEFTHGDK